MEDKNSLEKRIEEIKKDYEEFDKSIDKCLKEKPVVAEKILNLKYKYNLSDEQMKEILKNALKMANKFRAENKKKGE